MAKIESEREITVPKPASYFVFTYKIHQLLNTILKYYDSQKIGVDLHLLIAALMDDKGPWLNEEKKLQCG